MKFEEFQEQIKQLQAMYDKILNETEIKIWYENLKFMTIARFKYIISVIYKTKTYMPKLAEILEIHKELPYKPLEKEENKEYCKKCNNTGIIIYIKEIEGKPYKYACACTCGRANYDGRQMKDDKLKSDFYLASAEQLGFDNITNTPSKEEVISSMIKVKDSGIVSENIKAIVRKKLKEKNK